MCARVSPSGFEGQDPELSKCGAYVQLALATPSSESILLICWGRDRIGLTADFRLGGEAKTLKLHLHWSLLQPWLRLFLQAQPELCHQVSAYLMWNSSIWHFWNFWLRPDGKIIRQETHGFKQASFASLVQDTVLRFQTHCNWPTCLQPGPLRIYPPHCCLSIF